MPKYPVGKSAPRQGVRGSVETSGDVSRGNFNSVFPFEKFNCGQKFETNSPGASHPSVRLSNLELNYHVCVDLPAISFIE